MPLTVKINPKLQAQLRRANTNAARQVAGEYLTDMAEVLSNQPRRTGRLYEWRKGSLRPISEGPARGGGRHLGSRKIRRGRNLGRVHVASAPGEPPALLTGDLRRRRGRKIEADDMVVTVRFTSGVPYARRLEFGGKDSRGNMIEARPAWIPTWVKNRDHYRQIYSEEFKRGLG